MCVQVEVQKAWGNRPVLVVHESKRLLSQPPVRREACDGARYTQLGELVLQQGRDNGVEIHNRWRIKWSVMFNASPADLLAL